MEALLDARPHRREGAGGDGVLTDAPYLLVFDGERHGGARAATRLLRLLPGWRWAERLLSLPILRGATRIAHLWIADHRSFVSRVTGIGRSRTLDA